MRIFFRVIAALCTIASVFSCQQENVPVAVSSVTLDKTSETVSPGSSFLLSATVLPKEAAEKSVVWSSSNPAVATVTSGVVTGITSGACIITVTTVDGNKKANCLVEVAEVHVESVTVSPASMTLSVGGDPMPLTYTVNPVNAFNKKVSITSDNPSIATYISGLVVPVGEGATVIRVKSEDGGKTASCIVIVSSSPSVPVTGVSLDKTQIKMDKGGMYALTATVTPSNATNKKVTWSSSNPSVASVTGGIVSAVSDGSAVITVTTVDGGKTATCEVTVGTPAVPVTGVSLDRTAMALRKGASATLVATVTPANATNKSVTWSTSNSSIVSVSNGTISGKAVGKATITVTTVDGGKTATCDVTVAEAGEYPVGVTVVQNPSQNYAYAVIDFKANPNLRFNVSFVDNGAQLSNHFSNFKTRYPGKGTPIIMTNADFFFTWDGYKYSCDLVMTGSQMKRYPAFEDSGYYPVRSTLGRNSDGSFEISWARGGGDGGGPNFWSLYKYAKPVKYTSLADAEAAKGTSRTWWWPDEAVGGGPRIVENGKNTAKYYYDLERCSFSGGTSDSYTTAKTMYGFRADGCMVILVEWYLTLAQGADRMIELGCVDAINFDGGGSSEMLGPGGKKLQAQTDASERYMPSAICISEL